MARIQATRHLDCGCALVLTEQLNGGVSLSIRDHEDCCVGWLSLPGSWTLDDLARLIGKYRRRARRPGSPCRRQKAGKPMQPPKGREAYEGYDWPWEAGSK